MDVSKLTEWLKLSSEHLVGVLLFSSAVLGTLILAPDDWLRALGLAEFSNEYRTWLGLLLVLSTALLIVRLVTAVFRWSRQEVVLRRNVRRRRQRLHTLTGPERGILAKYVKENTRTQYLDVTDGVVRGLEAEQIIYRPASLSANYTVFAYNIQPWAWDYLNQPAGTGQGTT